MIRFGGEIRTVERVTHFNRKSIAPSQTDGLRQFGAAFQKPSSSKLRRVTPAEKKPPRLFTGVTVRAIEPAFLK